MPLYYSNIHCFGNQICSKLIKYVLKLQLLLYLLVIIPFLVSKEWCFYDFIYMQMPVTEEEESYKSMFRCLSSSKHNNYSSARKVILPLAN